MTGRIVARISDLLSEFRRLPLGEADDGRSSIEGDLMTCPTCGEVFDMRNLAEVFEHQHGAPIPHDSLQ